jgi:acetyl esterase
MPLDPNIAGLLQFIEASGYPPVADGTPEDARAGLVALMTAMSAAAPKPEVGSATDATVGGVPARVYRPEAAGAVPTIVYFHGGGFVIGDLATHDGICRLLCRDLSAVVVSVDYRLAPEHPFPAAVDDSYAALTAVAKEIGEYGGDAARLAVGGDSAGGNLAAVCAQLAHADDLELAAQLLVYPAVDLLGENYQSRIDNGEGYFLTYADMSWFAGHYLGVAVTTEPVTDPDLLARAADPRLSPLLATSLAGLAPAVVATAEYDPLRDEGNAYAKALEAAGVRVEHREFAGLIHGFYGLESVSPAVAEATSWINERFRDVIG